MKNKIITVFLAIFMILSFVACGTTNNTANNTANNATDNTTDNTNDINDTKDIENSSVVNLTFWHSMDGSYLDIVNEQVKTFNETVGKEKGIFVTAVFNDWPGTESLTTAMANDDIKNMPDVIQLYNESVSVVRNYDRLVWAEDYLNDASSEITKDDLLANAVASFAIDGKSIAVPYNVSALLLYYNKTILEAAGYSAPPATIAEMADMLPELTEYSEAEYGLNVCIQQFELNNYIATQGSTGSYFGNNESGHNGYMTALACADDGTLMNFLNEWKKVIDSDSYKAVKDSYNEEFATGINAMLMTSSSRIKSIEELVDGKFEWDVAPIPKVSADDIGGAYASGGGLFMLDRDDDAKIKASWEFIQYMVSTEAQMKWAGGTGYVPVNVNIVEKDEYKSIIENNSKFSVAYEVLVGSSINEVGAFCPASDNIDTIVKEAMVAFAGGALVDNTYNAIVDGCNNAMDDYYRVNPIE